jgi:3-deoxy-D-manno-octulosonate 8-phosphate phosphatase (KDO 8-P phosphatase)
MTPAERASRVRFVLLDVDGVLTDGRLYVDAQGRVSQSFDVRDGQGVRIGQRAGLGFGIVSGRESGAVRARAEDLEITEIHQGVRDKAACLVGLLGRLDLTGEEVCFVGDDLVDLPVMRRVGFAAAPLDAVAEARAVAHYVASRPGGAGAVREIVEWVLRARGEWDRLADRYGG